MALVLDKDWHNVLSRDRGRSTCCRCYLCTRPRDRYFPLDRPRPILLGILAAQKQATKLFDAVLYGRETLRCIAEERETSTPRFLTGPAGGATTRTISSTSSDDSPRGDGSSASRDLRISISCLKILRVIFPAYNIAGLVE